MTALITFACDRLVDQHSICARRTSYRTTDPAVARRDASEAGWFFGNAQQGDRCPSCSGRRP